MTDWNCFRQGMEAARKSGEPGAQANSGEARQCGGPDFIEEERSEKQRDWHRGYDYAVMLARHPVFRR